MKNKKQNVVPVLKNSYLRAIRNSIGTKLFRNFYAKVDGKSRRKASRMLEIQTLPSAEKISAKKDILHDGDLSCAYFVSCVLKIFDLIGKTHLTVEGTEADMKKAGWKIVKVPNKGSVLVWEKKKFGKEEHSHIGFFIGNGKAISNSAKNKIPVEHSFTFGGKRRIQAIYWHKKLEK